MADSTDDWWDPTPAVWYGETPQDKTEYRILRAAKTPVPGEPGFLIQWKLWKTYTSKTTRDSELTKITKEHPKWRLKKSEGNPYLEKLGIPTVPQEGIN